MAPRAARNSSSPTTQSSGDPPKLLFVTSFFRHHGVAFFELIVQAFLREPGALDRLLLGQAAGLPARVLEQRCLSEAPPAPPRDCPEFVLLVPGSRTGRLASTDWAKFGTPQVIRRLAEQGFLKPALAERLEENPSRFEGHDDEGGSALNLAKALEVVREARCKGHDLWPLVKECTLPDQREWLRSHHAWAPGKAPFRIETVEEDSGSQPDERSWALGLRTWLRATVERSPGTRLVVNLGGTARHDQLAWYVLATREHDLRKAAFVSCTTPRRGPNAPLYRPLHVKPTSKDLLWELAGTKAAPGKEDRPDPVYAQRLDWLRSFKESGGNFVILLRGPRGTGKSRAVEEVWGKGIPILNCGQFGDDLNMARSELFGHVKGAFTGALDDKAGAFEQAHGGALFLDEIHHLTRPMQAVLLRALQTDDENNFRYRPLGSSREKTARFQLIAGTNVSWDEMRAKLLADFIDRIHQRCVEFPAIEPGRIEAAWAGVWRGMRFDPAHDPWSLPTSDAAAFKEWLMQECDDGHLAGNFRDLQRIAILCSDWQQAAHRDPKLPKPTTGDDQQPLHWLDRVKHDWAASRRARLPAPPSPEAVATPATREPPPVLEIACDAAQAHDPTLFLDHCKDQFARHHLDRHRTYRAAAESLKGAKRTTEGTLRRWRRP